MSNAAIRAVNLSKRYRLGAKNKQTQFRNPISKSFNYLLNSLQPPSEEQILWALKDVSFEIEHGSVTGIIGHNGAGKSTLLKILSRITEPTSGYADINGRIGALLEVSTGFHPELTGRENIYMNGAILGMTKAEIDRKFDEIVSFAGVEKFIDTPVKYYSTGMGVRLGFGVAAHLEPEILLVDEVLSVGDAAFQKKSLGKMESVSKQGRTILLVTHNLGSIRQLCSKCIWMDQGRLRDYGETTAVVNAYLKASISSDMQSFSKFDVDQSKVVQVHAAQLLNEQGEPSMVFSCDEPIIIELTHLVHSSISGLYGSLNVVKHDGTLVMMSYSYDTVPNPLDIGLEEGMHTFYVTIPPRMLAPGNYQIKYAIGRGFLSTTANLEVLDSPGIIASFTLDDSNSIKGNLRSGYFSTLLNWKKS